MAEASKMLLRMQFEAETDIKMLPHPDEWKQYAEWLEDFTINDLNEEIIEKSNALSELIHKTIDMLQEEILKI